MVILQNLFNQYEGADFKAGTSLNGRKNRELFIRIILIEILVRIHDGFIIVRNQLSDCGSFYVCVFLCLVVDSVVLIIHISSIFDFFEGDNTLCRRDRNSEIEVHNKPPLSSGNTHYYYTLNKRLKPQKKPIPKAYLRIRHLY